MIHIDEDEFLLKQLTALDFHVCRTVFDEIYSNVFNKFKSYPVYPEQEHKEIEKKLNNFRDRIFNDDTFLSLADDVKEMTGYKKINGEFHSTLLSTYINTFERIYVHFYTDDRPALAEFSPFLTRNQIGSIRDSVDLLVLLYRHNDSFNKNDLKKYLSKLFSEYVSTLSEIEKAVEAYQIPKLMIRNQSLREKRDNIREAIKSRDVIELQSLYFSLLDDKQTCDSLIMQLVKFQDFFKQNISREYLDKIKECISYVDDEPFYKWAS